MQKNSSAFYFLFFAFLAIDSSVALAQNTNAEPQYLTPKSSSLATPRLTFIVINSEQNTFGYNILENKRIMIHQPSVPGLPGNKGFTTKEDATKVAKLVIKKINKNIMPPAVSLQELRSLKIKI